MEIQLTCFECLQEYTKIIESGTKPSPFLDPRDDNVSVELNDLGTYSGKCKKGHDLRFIIQNPKFEILFDLGVISLIEGYTREAVSSLIASYERFLEFSSFVFLLKLGIENGKVIDLFAKMKLSERQIGAYSVLHLACLNKAPELLKGKPLEFRNNVIHNGYIPTKDEVIRFGNDILSVILPAINELKNSFQDQIMQFTMESILVKSKMLPEGKNNSTMCMASGLGLYNKDENNKDFSSIMESIDRMKGLTFSKFYESEKKDNRYKFLEAILGRYV